jgi:hypothetical protein
LKIGVNIAAERWVLLVFRTDETCRVSVGVDSISSVWSKIATK